MEPPDLHGKAPPPGSPDIDPHKRRKKLIVWFKSEYSSVVDVKLKGCEWGSAICILETQNLDLNM